MVMSRYQNVGQNEYVQIGNKSFESVEQFKYLRKPLNNQNSTGEEIKSRLKSGKCLLSFCAESLVFQFTIQKRKD
jgi:hypothetical protein